MPARRQSIALAALALAAVVLAVRLTVHDPNELAGLLLVVPIALIAVEFGLLAGLGSALAASAFVVIWAVTSSAHWTPLAYTVRLAIFVLVGVIVGQLSEQRGEAALETERWFEMSNDMLAIANLKGYFTRLNATWETCLGWTIQELTERPYVEFIHPDDVEDTTASAASLAEGPTEIVGFENRYRTKEGDWRWLLWSARSDGRQIYWVAKDVTERKAIELERDQLLRSAEAIARTDALTGLANRRSWDEELHRELARARRMGYALAIVMVDLDEFKEFNDAHGHQAGDELLKELAAGWRMVLRVTDHVARYGGDEFCMLLPDCPPYYAESVVARIRAVSPERASCSAGIAYWDGEESAEALVARADGALYAAKRGGRNQMVTSTERGTPEGPPQRAERERMTPEGEQERARRQ